jgi:hypothetical protein
MITKCKDCKHLINVAKAWEDKSLWYNHFCKASTLPPSYSHYDGKMQKTTQYLFKHCMQVNKGDCPKYEPIKKGKLR